MHDVLRDVDNEHYVGILFRNSFPELEKTLIRESYKTYPKLGASYSESKKLWTFPSGALIYFGYLERDVDVEQYQGAEFQYVGFDELTHFSRFQFTYLASRLRGPHGIKPRMRATTNPGSRGHAWVKARWAPWVDRSAEYKGIQVGPGEVLRFRYGAKGEEYHDEGRLNRTFIPAKLSDNPKLSEHDPGYADRLDMLDPVTRAQLKEGRWDVQPTAGLYFQRGWFSALGLDALPPDIEWIRFWDKAATEPHAGNEDPDWTVGLKIGKSASTGLFYLGDMVRMRGGPGAVEASIKVTAASDGKAVKIRMAQDPGSAGKSEVAAYVRLLEGYDIRTKSETGDKVTRAAPVSAQASPKSTGGNVGRFVIVAGGWNEIVFQELEAFPDGDHDDIVDALSGGFDWLVNGLTAAPGQVGVRVFAADLPVDEDAMRDAYDSFEGLYS